MNRIQIEDIGSEWYEYRLSPDGTSFSLFTDKGELLFLAIAKIVLAPSSTALQRGDLRKEIYDVKIYRLRDHTVRYLNSSGYPESTVVEIGPPGLKAMYGLSDRKILFKMHGVYLAGDDLALTIICGSIQQRELPEDILALLRADSERAGLNDE